MRQTITALLLALVLALGLSGCTSKKDSGMNSGTTNNGSSYNDGNTSNGTMNGGTNSDTNYNNGSNHNGTNYDNGTDDSSGNSLMDETEDLLRGRSYEEMLRNGRVNDTDGDLTDGENSTSR